jgi:hypothetical protein
LGEDQRNLGKPNRKRVAFFANVWIFVEANCLIAPTCGAIVVIVLVFLFTPRKRASGAANKTKVEGKNENFVFNSDRYKVMKELDDGYRLSNHYLMYPRFTVVSQALKPSPVARRLELRYSSGYTAFDFAIHGHT